MGGTGHCSVDGVMGSEFDSVPSTRDVPGATSCMRIRLPVKPYPCHVQVTFSVPPCATDAPFGEITRRAPLGVLTAVVTQYTDESKSETTRSRTRL